MSARKVFSLFGSIAIEGMAKTKKEMQAFNKDVSALNKKMNALGKDLTKTGSVLTKTVTAGFAAVGASMVALSNQTGQYADKLLDLKEITGLTTDNLQGLEDVARVAGVDFEGLTRSITSFTSRLPQIINEGGAASDAINALGVNVFDSAGNVRDMNDLFPEMVNKLQTIESETDRNILSQQIFGKSLKDLAPVIGMNSDEFNGLLKNVKESSGYMSEDALNSANDYRITMEGLKDSFTGLLRDLSTKFIPILMNTLVPFVENNVIPVFETLINIVGGVTNWFTNLSKPLKEGVLLFSGLMAIAGPITLIIGKIVIGLKTLVPLYIALTKGQLALNASMTANPIGLIVAGVAALITIGVLLWRNWDTVKEKFIGAWDAIYTHFMNFSNKLDIKFTNMIIKMLEGIQNVTKFIPGMGKGINELTKRLKLNNQALQNNINKRTAEYESKKLSKEMTEEEVKVIEEATKVNANYNMSLLKTNKTKKESIEIAKEEKAQIIDLNKDREAFEKEWSNKLFNQVSDRITILSTEKDQALLIADQMGVDKSNIIKYYENEITKVELDEKAKRDQKDKELYEKQQKRREDVKNTAIGTIGDINKTWAASISLRTNLLEEQTARERLAIENSMMNEEEKTEAIKALEEDADEKKKELQRENAIREKAMSIFSIILNTATAITKALSLGMPAGLIFAALVGALGVAQIAIAAAQPIPFADGGLVKSAPGTGVIAQIGEGGQDELILPMKTGAAQLASDIMGRMGIGKGNQAGSNMSGGGESHTHLHIGTLIADELGLKNLERTLRKFRIAESQRSGFVTA